MLLPDSVKIPYDESLINVLKECRRLPQLKSVHITLILVHAGFQRQGRGSYSSHRLGPLGGPRSILFLMHHIRRSITVFQAQESDGFRHNLDTAAPWPDNHTNQCPP
eukprot:119605-Amphidinium_carterae.1